jgi:hypothetical protein
LNDAFNGKAKFSHGCCTHYSTYGANAAYEIIVAYPINTNRLAGQPYASFKEVSKPIELTRQSISIGGTIGLFIKVGEAVTFPEGSLQGNIKLLHFETGNAIKDG